MNEGEPVSTTSHLVGRLISGQDVPSKRSRLTYPGLEGLRSCGEDDSVWFVGITVEKMSELGDFFTSKIKGDLFAGTGDRTSSEFVMDFYDEFIASNTDLSEDELGEINERSKSFLGELRKARGEKRPSVTIDTSEFPDISQGTEKHRLAQIEQFKQDGLDELAEKYPFMREDAEISVEKQLRPLRRKIRGENTSWFADTLFHRPGEAAMRPFISLANLATPKHVLRIELFSPDPRRDSFKVPQATSKERKMSELEAILLGE